MKQLTLWDDSDQITVEFQPDCWAYWYYGVEKAPENIDTVITKLFHARIYRQGKFLFKIKDYDYYNYEPYDFILFLNKLSLTDWEALGLLNCISTVISQHPKSYDMEWLKENRKLESTLQK